jgi:hypothetical protein
MGTMVCYFVKIVDSNTKDTMKTNSIVSFVFEYCAK